MEKVSTSEKNEPKVLIEHEVKNGAANDSKINPKGIWISNEAWQKIVSDLSVFKNVVIESVAKSFQTHGEVR